MQAPKSTTFTRERAPEGQYGILCTQIIDLGTSFNRNKNKDERKVRFMFLTPHVMKEGDYAGKPIAILANFNYSMYMNSHLAGFIQQWLGKNFATQEEADEFDLESLLNKTAWVNVVHNGDFDNIGSIMPMIPGQVAPTAPVGAVVGTFTVDKPNLQFLEKLGQKTQERIKASYEMQKLENVSTPTMVGTQEEPPIPNEDTSKPDFDDDIPF